MEVEGDFWNGGCRRDGCRQPLLSTKPTVSPHHGDFVLAPLSSNTTVGKINHGEASPIHTDIPPVLSKRTVIIWRKRDCGACVASEPIFKELEVYGRTKANPPFDVMQVEVSPELLEKRFTHVLAVPKYDLVEVNVKGKHSPYGPDTEMRSADNDRQALNTLFPGLLPEPTIAVTKNQEGATTH